MWWYIPVFFILGFILVKSADAVVKAVSYLSRSLRIESFLFAFFLLGFATTIPEMFVAGQSILDGIPQLSTGNLLGGSILLLSLVMGGSAIFLGRVVLNHGMTVRGIGMSAIVVAAPAIALWDGALTRTEGVFLIIVYLLHVVMLNKEQHMTQKIEIYATHVKHAGHAVFLGIAGLAGIGISSRILVFMAETIVHRLGISPFILGLFLVTVGTNLPELALAFEAVIKKKRDIAFGDILGSAVINTPLLGLVCIIAPFSVADLLRLRVTLVLLFFTAVFFFWAATSKRDISRREGIGLLILYILFVLIEMTRV